MSASAILGGVQRKVGCANDLLTGHTIVGCDSDADRCADDAAPVFQTVRLAQHGDDLHRQIAQNAAVVDVGQHHLEFVAAQPTDFAFAVNRTGEAGRDLLQQFVPRAVAERVVDMLEAVKINHHHRAMALRSLEGGQCRFDLMRHAMAVGEAGERIEPRKPGGLLFPVIFVTDVSARAAKPRKAPICGGDGLT